MNKEIYVPSALRHFKEEERKEAWGVGIQNRIGEFGMTDGPFATEKEALECIGSHKSRIIHSHQIAMMSLGIGAEIDGKNHEKNNHGTQIKS